MTDIKLGMRVKDTLTGYEGFATGRCRYLTGCDRIIIERTKEDGETSSWWVDEMRCEVVDPDPEETRGLRALPEPTELPG